MLVANATAAVHFMLTPHRASLPHQPAPVYGLALLVAVVAHGAARAGCSARESVASAGRKAEISDPATTS
ncbi:MAG TPA: hypothetical protein VGK14_00995 [Novimethylophilus sp.]|jgi:hypothetical protein|uniref:hypothetical protein n=1 Tax=Novimethylophilus sp. TaxID=2137426 RepID=UPI002F3FE182